jgi:hypothetical protein
MGGRCDHQTMAFTRSLSPVKEEKEVVEKEDNEVTIQRELF